MPLPFFCAVCEKPIRASSDHKYPTIHDKCMENYLEAFEVTTADDFNKNSTSTGKAKKK